MKSDWHRTWFDQDYLNLYKHRSPQEAMDFLNLLAGKGLLLSPDAGICLDLGCGSGRHARALANRGHRVLALDWSPDLLREALQEKQAEAGNPFFLRGDLHQPPFPSGAAMVFSLFSSFGYSEDDSRNTASWRHFLQLPATGGRLIFDYLNPSYLKENLVPESHRMVDEIRVEEKRRLRQDLNMVEKKITMTYPDGRQREVMERVKLYSPEWFLEDALKSNYRQLAHWGELDGRPWTESSSRSILILERRDT